MTKSNISEAGLLGQLIAGAARLGFKGAKAGFGAAAAKYSNSNFASAFQAKKALDLWVKKITKDWIAYSTTQRVKPTLNTLRRFVTTTYGINLPNFTFPTTPTETPPVVKPRISVTAATGATTESVRHAIEGYESKTFSQIAESILPLLENNDAELTKEQVVRVFTVVAQQFLTDPDIRYASMKADPSSPKYAELLAYLKGNGTTRPMDYSDKTIKELPPTPQEKASNETAERKLRKFLDDNQIKYDRNQVSNLVLKAKAMTAKEFNEFVAKDDKIDKTIAGIVLGNLEQIKKS